MFQLNTKQLFLTYPQCPLPKQEALDYLLTLLDEYNVLEYIVAHEHHANGADHLHCYFKLELPYRTRDSTALDIGTHHGNYQGCRSAKNVVRYCTKEEDYLSNFDVAAVVNKKSNRRMVAEELLLKKRPLVDVIQDHPELIFGYTKLKLDLIALQEDLAVQKNPLPTWIPNPWGKLLPSFKSSKKRHYWIWSDGPNYGKTTGFAKPLAEEYDAVIQTGDFFYWNVTRSTECLILDDYNTAKLNWSSLNQLCDNTFAFRVFQRGSITLKKYVLIILSNAPISELYPNMHLYLYARFNEIKL